MSESMQKAQGDLPLDAVYVCSAKIGDRSTLIAGPTWITVRQYAARVLLTDDITVQIAAVEIGPAQAQAHVQLRFVGSDMSAGGSLMGRRLQVRERKGCVWGAWRDDRI